MDQYDFFKQLLYRNFLQNTHRLAVWKTCACNTKKRDWDHWAKNTALCQQLLNYICIFSEIVFKIYVLIIKFARKYWFWMEVQKYTVVSECSSGLAGWWRELFAVSLGATARPRVPPMQAVSRTGDASAPTVSLASWTARPDRSALPISLSLLTNEDEGINVQR